MEDIPEIPTTGCQIEVGSYTGNGSTTRTISIPLSTWKIMFLYCENSDSNSGTIFWPPAIIFRNFSGTGVSDAYSPTITTMRGASTYWNRFLVDSISNTGITLRAGMVYPANAVQDTYVGFNSSGCVYQWVLLG